MEEIQAYLRRAVAENCSDIYVVAGKAVTVKKNGVITPIDQERLTPETAETLMRELYDLAHRPVEGCLSSGDDNFSTSIAEVARFRVNAYRQRGSLAAAIRVVRFGIPDRKECHIPDEVIQIAELSSGLALVTGPAGGGKSTTLACIVDAINESRNTYIVTAEDPIEFLHQDKKGFVTQRELAVDMEDYSTALHSAVRQGANVIVLGALNSREIIQQAIAAAEAGHLVISTLNTVGATDTISYILGLFPDSKERIRVQLSKVLRVVVSQQLLATVDGGLIPAFEILWLDGAARDRVREDRVQELDSILQNFSMGRIKSMDDSIFQLYRTGQITKETAMEFAVNAEQFGRKLMR